MNDTNTETQPQSQPKTYKIGDKTYRMEPASYRQHRWLKEGPLKGVDLSSDRSNAEIQALLRDHAPEILGIVLIADGQTREEKVRAGLQAARDLAEFIDCNMTPEEVRPIAEDFFPCNGFKNLVFFVDFHKVEASMPDPSTENGLTRPSVSLPAETSPSETRLSAVQDRPTASPICVDSSSVSLPI